jgi:hypothetical protein
VIRVVPSGDLGLDVLLGGGFRLVKRLPDTESATVLVRGGAGAGKTLVGLHVALELAKALGGDVVVACVEILPTEYVAQIQAARTDIDQRRVAVLPEKPRGGVPGPRVYCALLTELDTEAPDLVGCLEALGRDVASAGGKPAVFIVDSLIEGYGIGGSAPRTAADAVMKLAAQGGYGLVLCEEVRSDDASPWVFAADTVIELGVAARERGRWIEVRKNRFGASVSGRHELDLGAGTPPAAFPEPQAWVARDLREVLQGHGWKFQARAGLPALTWDKALAPAPDQDEPRLEGAFVVIVSALAGVARSLAYALRPYGEGLDVLVIELDPLVAREAPAVGHVPTVHGAARALRSLIERFGTTFEDQDGPRPAVRRVVVGDLDHVLAAPDALAWVQAMRVFASLVIDSGWGIPLIVYATSKTPPAGAAAVLSAYADLKIIAAHGARASFAHRWRRASGVLTWPQEVTTVRMPFDQLPRPPGRRIDH